MRIECDNEIIGVCKLAPFANKINSQEKFNLVWLLLWIFSQLKLLLIKNSITRVITVIMCIKINYFKNVHVTLC
jgi:hypothetical protein